MTHPRLISFNNKLIGQQKKSRALVYNRAYAKERIKKIIRPCLGRIAISVIEIAMADVDAIPHWKEAGLKELRGAFGVACDYPLKQALR